MAVLDDVKSLLGITGTYLNTTLTNYITEVTDYLTEAGIDEDNIPSGLVARGVIDLWNYGSNDGKLSEYFYQRATQLSYLEEEEDD